MLRLQLQMPGGIPPLAQPFVQYFEHEVMTAAFAEELGIGLATNFAGGFFGRLAGACFSNRFAALCSRSIVSHLLSSRLSLFAQDLHRQHFDWNQYKFQGAQDLLGILGVSTGEFSSNLEHRFLFNKPQLLRFVIARGLGGLSIGLGNFLGQATQRLTNTYRENRFAEFSLKEFLQDFPVRDLSQELLKGVVTDSAFQLAHLSLSFFMGVRHLRLSSIPVACRGPRQRLLSNEDIRLPFLRPRKLPGTTQVKFVNAFSEGEAILHQVGPFSELCDGHYQGRVFLDRFHLTEHSQGIGAADRMKGELITADGKVHRSCIKDGTTEPINPHEMQTPFFVTFKSNESGVETLRFYNVSFDQLAASLKLFLSPHRAYGISISGLFDEILYRVPPLQAPPFPPLQVVGEQALKYSTGKVCR